MVMIPNGPGQGNNYMEFITNLKALVAAGRVAQSRIDDAVKRILRAKMDLGLFEHPNADPELFAQIGSTKHRAVARECVRQSLVLLRNEHQTLPLSKYLKHLTVVGQAADDLGMQCGGWTIDWQGKVGNVTTGGTTLLAAIKQSVSRDTEVAYSPDANNLHGAEAIIVVVGEMPYAEMKGDRSDLSLAASDAALIEKARATGVPVVTVLYSGRPLVLGKSLEASDAFVAAWLPGTEGAGITDVLFGDFKPTGRLPRPWPHDNSGLTSATFATHGTEPLFAAGFGLTYAGSGKNKELKTASLHE
jgi:beta-glucosidase